MEIELTDGRKVNLEMRSGSLFIDGINASDVIGGILENFQLVAQKVLEEAKALVPLGAKFTGLRVGFSGTSKGMTAQQRFALLTLFTHTTILAFHHGDCIGADEEAHQLVNSLVKFPDEKSRPKSRRQLLVNQFHERKFPIIIHPSSNPKKRAFCKIDPTVDALREEFDYLVRDRAIVDETDVLVACPHSESSTPHSGTWYTINYAIQKGKPVCIVLPDGRVRRRDSSGERILAKLKGL